MATALPRVIERACRHSRRAAIGVATGYTCAARQWRLHGQHVVAAQYLNLAMAALAIAEGK